MEKTVQFNKLVSFIWNMANDVLVHAFEKQKMFMMLGKAEKAGSGADKISSGWRKSNWNSPILEEKSRPDKVVLTMPLVSMLGEEVKGRGTTYHLNETTNLASNLTSPGRNLASNLTSSDADLTSIPKTRFPKKRCSQKELFELILECASDWKSLEELAQETHRNSQYLKSFVRKMVESGLLTRAYAMPNHPAQKYRKTRNEQ